MRSQWAGMQHQTGNAFTPSQLKPVDPSTPSAPMAEEKAESIQGVIAAEFHAIV